MTTLQRLDSQTRALLGLAAAVAVGDRSSLEARCRECRETQVPAQWVEELLLQSILMVGWPRALQAFTLWRRGAGPSSALPEPPDDWRARGEAVCRAVYGKNYPKLRENMRALHPALDEWMISDGYGKTIGRPGLDLARRELGIALQVAVQGIEAPLHSHLQGALHAGASAQAVTEALELVRPLLDERTGAVVSNLWERIRP